MLAHLRYCVAAANTLRGRVVFSASQARKQMPAHQHIYGAFESPATSVGGQQLARMLGSGKRDPQQKLSTPSTEQTW